MGVASEHITQAGKTERLVQYDPVLHLVAIFFGAECRVHGKPLCDQEIGPAALFFRRKRQVPMIQGDIGCQTPPATVAARRWKSGRRKNQAPWPGEGHPCSDDKSRRRWPAGRRPLFFPGGAKRHPRSKALSLRHSIHLHFARPPWPPPIKNHPRVPLGRVYAGCLPRRLSRFKKAQALVLSVL